MTSLGIIFSPATPANGVPHGCIFIKFMSILVQDDGKDDIYWKEISIVITSASS